MKKIQLTENTFYMPQGFVLMYLPSLTLESMFRYNDVEFEVKDEFHCTIMSVRRVAAQFAIDEERLVASIQTALTQVNVTFQRYLDEFYHCTREDAQSIIVRCEVNGLEQLYEHVRQDVGIPDIPSPVPHVTLYKHNHPYGIAIPNHETFMQLCAPLEVETTEKLRQQVFSTL